MLDSLVDGSELCLVLRIAPDLAVLRLRRELQQTRRDDALGVPEPHETLRLFDQLRTVLWPAQ